MPVPIPNNTILHITSFELAEEDSPAIKNRDIAQIEAPLQARTLVPMRSERLPLNGATAITASGKEVIIKPSLLGAQWTTL